MAKQSTTASSYARAPGREREVHPGLIASSEADVERKKTTTITSETLETIVVRRLSSRSTWLWCVECAERVEMLTPDEAAALAKVSTRAIYRRIETGEIHHTETAERTLLVCPKRLSP